MTENDKPLDAQKLKNLPGGFKLLPPAADKCQDCATDHEGHLPHNRNSLYFQYSFYADNGRWPTWIDAMAHCTEYVRNFWLEQLRDLGTPEDQIGQ